MTAAEQQSDELEALTSIFDGDSSFSLISKSDDEKGTPTVIQYLFGDRESDQNRSFLLEIRWPKSYPDEADPEFNLDLFYNKHLFNETKTSISNFLKEESENLRGSPMTYSLIEIIKERFDQLIEAQTRKKDQENEEKYESTSGDDDRENDESSNKKKGGGGGGEKLTKAQKRKMWDRGQANDEKARGWNWIDVVKHLSQTGGQQ
jgi:hypothetical protein